MGYIGNQPYLGVATGESIADGSIGTVDLSDGAITAAKLATTAILDKLGYTPVSTSGTGATGTWGVSISGNAATATTAVTATNVSGGTASVTTLAASGNLTFSSTGQRITGDMSNATQANRLAFQTSTTNGNTTILAIPNGTGTVSQVLLRSSSGFANDSIGQIILNPASSFGFNALVDGTGTALPITFQTGGSERLRLDTSGRLGLGSTSPGTYSERFIIQSSAGTQSSAMWINPGQGSGQIGIAASGSNFKIYNTYTDGLLANGKGIDIDQNGNVGINTASPGYQLEISKANTSFRMTDLGANSTYVSAATISTQANIGVARQGGNPSSAFLYAIGNSSYLSLNGLFGTANLITTESNGDLSIDVGGSERMRITASSGNVGIGTASPSFKLVAANSGTDGGWIYSTGAVSVLGLGGYANSGNGAFQIRYDRATGDTTLNGGTRDTPAARVTIGGSGNVGIGTSNPGDRLDVVGGNIRIASGNTVRWVDAGNIRASIQGDSSSNAIFSTAGSERARITSGGNLLLGTAADLGQNARLNILTASGEADVITMRYTDATAGKHWRIYIDSNSTFYLANQGNVGVYITDGGNTWNSLSDERLKTDLMPIEDSLSKIGQLRAVTGRFKTDEEGTSRSFLIAQDVLAVLPEAVDARNPEKLGVAYTDVIPLLVAAIKELSAKVAALEEK